MNKIRELLYEKRAFREEYWRNMIRFVPRDQILEVLEVLMNALAPTAPEITNEDSSYLLAESCEQAYYHLYLSGDPELQRAASSVALALIKKEGRERVRFVRDVYIAVIKSDNEEMIRKVVDAISEEELASNLIDNAIYGLYDGNINNKNYQILKKMIFYLRHYCIQNLACELMTIFTLIDKYGDLLDDPMALELFKLSRRPLFITLNKE